VRGETFSTEVSYGWQGKKAQGLLESAELGRRAPADVISPPRSLVLDGCPMFATVYMGRKRILQMFSLHARGSLLLAAIFFSRSKSVGRRCAPS
jgi:hypothetical protein